MIQKRRTFLTSIAVGLYSVPTLGDVLQFTPLQTPPEPVQKVATDAKTRFDRSDFVLHVHSLVTCGPCRRWKAQERRKVRCAVALSNGGASTYPTFRLTMRYPLDGNTFVRIGRGNSTSHGVDNFPYIRWTGYTTAGQINSEVERQIRIRNGGSRTAPKQVVAENKNSRRRKTADELRQWARANDPTPQDGLSTKDATHQWDIANRNQTDSHLIYHGYSRAQISGLTLAEKLMVHQGTHRKLMSPWT